MQVIAANKEAKKSSALLDSDGDTFLKNECKADKWIIIELSQVTKIDTIVLTQVSRITVFADLYLVLATVILQLNSILESLLPCCASKSLSQQLIWNID